MIVYRQESMEVNALTWFAQLLVIIGALNWGLIGFFNFDLVAALFGGQTAFLSRVIYSLVGISGLIAISFLVRDRETNRERIR
ncbi:MAG: hypothetical protein K0R39_3963 [Symbiobacteriaceae bacterium]|jgi:uncharacterized membrane protein YuzA (DUF378 family)|nr:hypothetical protein [Symbiobacteriaceae bacterium]